MSHSGTVVPDWAPSAEGLAGHSLQPHCTCMLSFMKRCTIVFWVELSVDRGYMTITKLFLMKLTPTTVLLASCGCMQLTYF